MNIFPNYMQKMADYFIQFFKIPDIITLITKIRYKIALEIIIIGAF